MTKDERDADVDRKINAALAVGLEHGQDAPQMAFIDTVVRPAMKWINDMEAGKIDVALVENAVCSGLASILGEVTLRVNRRDNMAGGIAFGQKQIITLAEYLTDNIKLNFYPPGKSQ